MLGWKVREKTDRFWLTFSTPNSYFKFSQPFKKKMIEWYSEKWLFHQLSSELNYLLPNSPYCMIYLWWETERENWSWSLLRVKGLKKDLMWLHSNSQVTYENMKSERDMMKEGETRLLQENKSLLEQQRSQNVLLTNLQTMQVLLLGICTVTSYQSIWPLPFDSIDPHYLFILGSVYLTFSLPRTNLTEARILLNPELSGEIWRCDHSNESSRWVHSSGGVHVVAEQSSRFYKFYV